MSDVTERAAEPRVAANGQADRRAWLLPIAVYVGVLVALLVVSSLVVGTFTEDPRVLPLDFTGDSFLSGWVRWDGGWYVQIAEFGYSYIPGEQSRVAFFPAYPLTMRVVGGLVDVPLAGILVTIACGLTASVLYWRWCRSWLPATAVATAVLVLAVYPYSWFLYGAVYGDALFLAAVLASFLLLERDHPVLAGIAGAVATATRPVGIALVIGLVLRTLELRGALVGEWRFGLPRRIERHRLRGGDAGVLLSVGGLVAYCAYLWHRFGDPLLFSSVQEAWGQPASPRTWSKYQFVTELFRGDDRKLAYALLAHAIVTALFVIAIPFVVRRFGWGYGGYVVALVAIPLVGSKDFQGLGRYLLAAFPVFALAGEALAQRPTLRRVAVPLSAGLLVVGTAGFAHGLYLA